MVLAVIWLPHIVGGSDSEIEPFGIPEELEVSELLAEGYLKADRVDTVVDKPVDKPVVTVLAGGDYADLINQYSWNPQIAYAVMMAESRGNPQALNNNPATADYSVGLFQINLYGALANDRPSEEWLRIPENNIAYAYKMWQQSGWYPWSVYKSGAYLQYLE